MRKTYIFVFIYKYAYDGQDVKQTNGSVGTYIKDHHGNIIGGRSKSGTMFADKDNCMEYDAFGNKRNKNIPAPFGYCGEYTDAESGLVYLRNRYYDTTTGRFITEDPAKDGLNWYSYCAGNPVVFADPSGFSSVPRDLDWDEDGKIDSKADRQRFDSDNNGIADWNENRTYIAPKEWYRYESSNILNNFKHVDQGNTEYCWSACLVMCVDYLAKLKMDFVTLAEDTIKKYNKKDDGMTITGVAEEIISNGFLSGSGYEVNLNIFNFGYLGGPNRTDYNPLTFNVVVQQIDRGIPIVLKSPIEENHMIVIVGYAEDNSTGKQMLLTDNPNESALMYREIIDFKDFQKVQKTHSSFTFQKK